MHQEILLPFKSLLNLIGTFIHIFEVLLIELISFLRWTSTCALIAVVWLRR